ncbi:MAG: multiheme c-type cytochrome [Acidobacteriota bacterium]
MTILEHLGTHRARRFALVPLLALCPLTIRHGEGQPDTRATQSGQDSKCVACHSRSVGPAREVITLHAKSSHRQLGCDGCHGGEAGVQDQARAHSGAFVGKPDFSATLTMCAQCHATPLAQFKEGRHFRRDRAISKMDCVTCHGAHTIGSPPETFSLGQFCAGCHGLEYLPQLPVKLRELLSLGDELRASFRAAQSKHLNIPEEFNDARKAIRRSVSQIVHPTDLKGAEEKIPVIIEQGRLLKARMSRLNSKGDR